MAHFGKFIAYYRVSTQKQGRSGLGLPPMSPRSAGAAPTSDNTRWCKGLNFCGRRNRVPRSDY